VQERVQVLTAQLLTVLAADEEERRKGQLLSILLIGALAAALVLTLVNLVQYVLLPTSKSLSYVLSDVPGDVLFLGLLWLNHKGHIRLASYLFLILLVLVASFLFQINSLDRVMLLYVVPVMAASFVLNAGASFTFALFSSMGYTAAYLMSHPGVSYNYVSLIGLFVMALVAWLAASNLENSLREVRKRAEELDQRVMERTSDLAEALQREHSEASKNEAVLESIGDGVIVFDQNRQAIVVNPAACSILGCVAQSLAGQDIDLVMGDAVNAEDQAIIRSLIDSEASPRMSLKINWGRKILAVSFAQVRLPYVEQPGSVMVFRDITREAEVDRMKSEFVSIVSHELRTPMTVIKGYLDLILMGDGDSDPHTLRKFLHVVKANADRLGDMVDELLDVSRIEAGKVQIRFQPVSIGRIIGDVATMLENGMANKKDQVQLRLDVPEDLPEVLADPGRLTQIVTNLISNALKYTLEGHVDVAVRVMDSQMQVDVRDTGIGMTEDDQAKLFTRFFRASTARSSDIPGTGLGLAITRSLIEMHGGRIWVKSEVGQGSTFSFTLPLVPESLANMVSPHGASMRVLPEAVSPKILVVDDELHTAQLIRHQLEASDYTVLITTHGKDVLPLARREKPNLILFDVLIRDANGIEVLHQLDQDSDTQPIPVIVTSIGPEDPKEFALGAAEYLTKPIDEEELLTTVRRVLVAHMSNKARVAG